MSPDIHMHIHKMTDPTLFTTKITNLRIPCMTYVNSQGSTVPIDGIVEIETPGDGSCMFHSIMRAFNLNYNGMSHSERRAQVLKVRSLLAEAIGTVNPETGKIYYDEYGNGNMAELGRTFPRYSLASLQNLLRSNNSVGEEFLEPLSNFFNLDIYIINLTTRDVYLTGVSETMFKDRKSIVIGYNQSYKKDDGGGHYSTIGLNTETKIWTLFDPKHFFIRKIRDRIDHLSRVTSKGVLREKESLPVAVVSKGDKIEVPLPVVTLQSSDTEKSVDPVVALPSVEESSVVVKLPIEKVFPPTDDIIASPISGGSPPQPRIIIVQPGKVSISVWPSVDDR